MFDEPVIKKDYGTIWEGLRSKIFKKKERNCLQAAWSVDGRVKAGPGGLWADGPMA